MFRSTLVAALALANGGPWVMWKGSPYAHLMVPVSKTKGVSILVPKK